jgi:hypothetical protein
MLLFTLVGVVSVQAQEVPEQEAWFKAIDFCFRDKASSVAENKERSFAVWGVDPDEPTNGCIVATAGAHGTSSNAQLWIRGAEYVEPTYIGEVKDQLTSTYGTGGFAVGTGFKVTMRVKANGEYSVKGQAHKAFQFINHPDGFGTLNVTTSWQTVSFVCIATDAIAGFTDLCFDLAASGADRTFYFDDIQITRGADWYINNGFYAKDYVDDRTANPNTQADNPDKVTFHKAARFVDDAEGGYVEVVSNAKRTNTYDSQIWFTIPENFVGSRTKMTMQVWADQAVTTPGSFHATANGQGWGGGGAPSMTIKEASKWQ